MEYFPAWLRITHYVNFVFLTLLIRSGIQILSDHPKLYGNDHCTPGTEWLKFSSKKKPAEGYWTSMDEAVDVSPWIALPVPTQKIPEGKEIKFTFYWPQVNHWEGAEFSVRVGS